MATRFEPTSKQGTTLIPQGSDFPINFGVPKGTKLYNKYGYVEPNPVSQKKSIDDLMQLSYKSTNIAPKGMNYDYYNLMSALPQYQETPELPPMITRAGKNQYSVTPQLQNMIEPMLTRGQSKYDLLSQYMNPLSAMDETRRYISSKQQIPDEFMTGLDLAGRLKAARVPEDKMLDVNALPQNLSDIMGYESSVDKSMKQGGLPKELLKAIGRGGASAFGSTVGALDPIAQDIAYKIQHGQVPLMPSISRKKYLTGVSRDGETYARDERRKFDMPLLQEVADALSAGAKTAQGTYEGIGQTDLLKPGDEYYRLMQGWKNPVSKALLLGAEGVLPLAVAAGVTAATKNPMLGAATFAPQALTSMYQDAMKKGANHETAMNMALGSAVGQTYLENIPLGGFLKGGKLGKRVIRGIVEEGIIEEGTQQLLDNTLKLAGVSDPKSIADARKILTDGVVESMVAGAVMGAGLGVFSHEPKSVRDQLTAQFQQRFRQLGKDAIDGLVESALAAGKTAETRIKQQGVMTELAPKEAGMTNEQIGKAIEQGAKQPEMPLPATITAKPEGKPVEAKAVAKAPEASQIQQENVVSEIKPTVEAPVLAQKEAPSATETAQKPTIVEQSAPTPIKTLEQRAVEYKTPDEFIKSQGETLYHGSDREIESFDLEHPGRKDSGWLGRGVYFTDSKELARSYGFLKAGKKHVVMERYAKLENPYYATIKDKQRLQLIAHRDGINAGKVAASEWTDKLISQGHDGVILQYKPSEVGEKNVSREIVVFDPSKIKTKQQLTDIWNKAHGKNAVSPTQPTGRRSEAGAVSLAPATPALTSAFPAVESKWQEAKRTAHKKLGFWARRREDVRALVHNFTQHNKFMSSKEHAEEADLLRLQESAPEITKAQAMEFLGSVIKDMDNKQYDVFSRTVVLADLARSIRDGLYEGKKLPFDYASPEQVTQDLQRFQQAANADPVITAAMNRRNTFMNDLRRQLVDNKLLPETVLNDPDYFHRQVIEYMDLKNSLTANVSPELRSKLFPWMRKRIGSDLLYGVDYIQSEAEVVAQALYAVKTKQLLDKIEKISDITQRLKDEAKKKGIKDWRELIPEGYEEWQPDRGHVFYNAVTINDRIIDAAIADYLKSKDADPELTVQFDQLRNVLAMGGKKKTLVIPSALAETLKNFKNTAQDGLLESWARDLNNKWKQWTLINPLKILKYNINNMSGDADIVFAYDPRIFKYAPAAMKELWDWAHNGKKSIDVNEFHNRGGLSSSMTFTDVPSIKENSIFKNIYSPTPNLQAVTNILKRPIHHGLGGWMEMGKDFSTFRENILRLAAYKFFKAHPKERLYGVSRAYEIDKISDPLNKAAKLARELLGDYGNLSVAGNVIRAKMIPFYSWMEINAPRYVRLLQNAYKEDASLAGAVGRTAAVVAKKAVQGAAKVGMRAVLAMGLYMLINLWNTLRYPEESKTLSRGSRIPSNIIVGKRSDGSLITVKFQGALADAASWFSLDNPANDISDIQKGILSPVDKLKEIAMAPVNRVMSSISPIFKTPVELITGKSVYPDLTKAKPIRDRIEYALKTLSLDVPYQYIMGKPTRGKTPTDKLANFLLNEFSFTQDPGEGAYYDSFKMVNDFRNKLGVKKPGVEPSDKSNAMYYFKQAVKFGDNKAAAKYLENYIKLGGTDRGYQQSIRMANPLYGLKPEMISVMAQTMSPAQKDIIARGLEWYINTYVKGDKEAAEE